MKTPLTVVVVLGLVMTLPARVHDQASLRTLTIATTEVTAPAIAVSPDGQSLVITALGHLHLLPARGGSTTQLTTGPSYNSAPAYSPDGRRLAFVSNRDGSGSNIFVLDLASRRVTQLTREIEAARPAWSPDGRTIAYARNLLREDHPFESIPGFADTGLRELRTVPATGGEPAVALAPRNIESIFYLPDGRLAWTVRELTPGGGMFQSTRASRVETRNAAGAVEVLASAPGDLGAVVPAPAGDAIYYAGRGAVQRLPLGTGGAATAGPRVQEAGARVALAPDGSAVFYGERGGLFRAALSSGEPERIQFSASIRIEVRPRVRRTWTPPGAGASAAARPVLAPQLSPDGTRLLVMAAGHLWEQPVSGEAARRVSGGAAFVRDAVYSPDGRRIAFIASEHGKRELRVYDSGTGQSQPLFATGGAAWPLYPSWSPDGQRIVFQHTTGIFDPYRIVVLALAGGTATEVAQTAGAWTARPHFSADGSAIYYTARDGKIANLHRLSLARGARAEAVTDLSRHVHEGLVSPDGRWFAQRRNSEIWLAPLGASTVVDAQLRRVSAEGGRAFSFAPDSSAVLYTSGGRVWRQPLGGGGRTEVPVRLSMPPSSRPPVLVTRVRVLELEQGRFTGETAIFVEDGRIRWIGSEQGRRVPADAVRIDAGGRFAIPGLFDAHVHSGWSNQQANEDAFIAFGVTSVRDTGSTLDVMTALADRGALTALPAPRYFYSGEIFEGLMPHWGDAFYQIGRSEEARAEVRNLARWGAHFVKVYPSLPWHLQQVVADEAHRNGLPIVGHGLSPEEITRRVIAGSTSVEHGNAVTGAYADIHGMLAAAGTVADLTLSVGGGALMRASDPDWQTNWRVLAYVPDDARRAGARAGNGPGQPPPPGPQTREQLLQASRTRFDRILAAGGVGVPMTGGTDSLMGGVFFGLSLHWEIAQFADAGIPAIDVLRMATLGGAALVGAADDLGSIAPGKLADIVLLDASPLDDIRNTQRIWQVIKDGRVYDPARMRPGVEGGTR
jgi:Tol biopolymer transport system component/imidazolonepropionase-like amidohydrolase